MEPLYQIDLEEAIKIAHNRFLYPGYKPEDYAIVSEDVAKRIAIMIAVESFHIINVESKLFTIKEIKEFRYDWRDLGRDWNKAI